MSHSVTSIFQSVQIVTFLSTSTPLPIALFLFSSQPAAWSPLLLFLRSVCPTTIAASSSLSSHHWLCEPRTQGTLVWFLAQLAWTLLSNEEVVRTHSVCTEALGFAFWPVFPHLGAVIISASFTVFAPPLCCSALKWSYRKSQLGYSNKLQKLKPSTYTSDKKSLPGRGGRRGSENTAVGMLTTPK